jgi:hypothetical protein
MGYGGRAPRKEIEVVIDQEGRELALMAEPYGWTLVDKTYEWAITCRWTARQDGKTAWMVCMAEVDGEVRVEQGLDPSEEAGPKMRSAARRFTNHWIKPITSLVLPDWAG